MAHWKLLYPGEYISAVELQGKDVPITIEKIARVDIKMDRGTEKKVVVWIKERAEKKLILNKTNAATIAGIYGNDTEGWIGKRITLFPTTCQAFGETVDCIRVRDSAPAGVRKGPSAGTSPETAQDPPPDEMGQAMRDLRAALVEAQLWDNWQETLAEKFGDHVWDWKAGTTTAPLDQVKAYLDELAGVNTPF